MSVSLANIGLEPDVAVKVEILDKALSAARCARVDQDLNDEDFVLGFVKGYIWCQEDDVDRAYQKAYKIGRAAGMKAGLEGAETVKKHVAAKKAQKEGEASNSKDEADAAVAGPSHSAETTDIIPTIEAAYVVDDHIKPDGTNSNTETGTIIVADTGKGKAKAKPVQVESVPEDDDRDIRSETEMLALANKGKTATVPVSTGTNTGMEQDLSALFDLVSAATHPAPPTLTRANPTTTTMNLSLIDLPLPSSVASKLPAPLIPLPPSTAAATAAAAAAARTKKPAHTMSTPVIPGTLHNIPPRSSIVPITPDFTLPQHGPPPAYPTFPLPKLAHSHVHFADNPYRILIGPLSEAARAEWRMDNGKGYVRAKLLGVHGRNGVPVFCEMVHDVWEKAYVVALFESVAGAERAKGFFEGWACGGSIMWSWVYREAEWDSERAW